MMINMLYYFFMLLLRLFLLILKHSMMKRLAAARTKDTVVALELAAGECGRADGSGEPDRADGVGTTPCQIADNGREPTLQFKYSIE